MKINVVISPRFPKSYVLSKMISRLVKSQFGKNVLTLMTGNILAQSVSIATSPLLTRLYTPENFGILALFVAVLTVLDKLTTLSYERAIVIPTQDKDAAALFLLSFLILIFFSGITGAFALFWNESILALVKNQKIDIWLKIIPIALFLSGSVKIIRFWMIRMKLFKAISISRSMDSVSSNIVKIVIGFIFGSCSGGLIAGLMTGLMVSLMIIVLHPSVKKIKGHMSNTNSRQTIRHVAGKYRKFPLFSTLNAILNMLSLQLVAIMFTYYFSPAIVGFYSLGARVLKQPMIFISESIRNAYFQKAAYDAGQGQDLKHSFFFLTGLLGTISILPFFFLYFWSVPIFKFVFGPEWEVAGIYIKWMSPWFYILFISTPANVIYEIINKQDIKTILNVLKLISSFGAIYLGYWIYHDPLETLKAFVFMNIIMEIISLGLASTIVYKRPLTI